MATYGADYLRRLLGAIEEFEEAFESWIKTQEEGDLVSSRGIFPTVWPREGNAPADVRALELAVGEAAGAAARAVAVTGAYIGVAGLGHVDPIANWALMSAPKALFAPSDIRSTAATIRGRLRSMIADAEADGSDLPAFSPAQFHPTVWAAAATHWTTHQYRVAVREAAEALTVHWKAKVGRSRRRRHGVLAADSRPWRACAGSTKTRVARRRDGQDREEHAWRP